MKHPYGVVEDVLMKVDKFLFLIYFVILDMKEDEEVPLILGRPSMKTVIIIMDVDKRELRLRSKEDEVRFNLFKDVTDCIAYKNGRQEKISKEEVILITDKQMEGSKPKEEVTYHEKLETKGDQNNQGKPVEKDEYQPRQPIMLNAGRGKGMKKTKKLWVVKKLNMDGTIEVEASYSRKTKVRTRALAKQNNYPH